MSAQGRRPPPFTPGHGKSQSGPRPRPHPGSTIQMETLRDNPLPETSSAHLPWATTRGPILPVLRFAAARSRPDFGGPLASRKVKPPWDLQDGRLEEQAPCEGFAAPKPPKPEGGRAGWLGETRLRVPGPSTVCHPPSLLAHVGCPRLNPAPRRVIPLRPGRDAEGS